MASDQDDLLKAAISGVSEGKDGPAIQTGDIQNADFTVNKYYLGENGVESDRDMEMSQSDLDDLRSEIDANIEERLSDHGNESSEPETQSHSQSTSESTSTSSSQSTESTTSSESTSTKTGNESLDEIAEETQSREGSNDPFEVARRVVEENNITKNDWPQFSKEMREAGIADQSEQSDAWGLLKEEGIIEKPKSERSSSTSSQSAASGGQNASNGEYEIPEGADILMLKENSQSSEMVSQTLADHLNPEQIIPVDISSDFGQHILEPMDSSGLSAPFYLKATADGLVQRPLEDLLAMYLE